jgi:hypothetical protein
MEFMVVTHFSQEPVFSFFVMVLLVVLKKESPSGIKRMKNKQKQSPLIPTKAARLSGKTRRFPSPSHGRFGFFSYQINYLVYLYCMTRFIGKSIQQRDPLFVEDAEEHYRQCPKCSGIIFG